MAIAYPRYTIEDLEKFPDDGNRYELLDGVLLVTPQAALTHQLIAGRLAGELFSAVQKSGDAFVLGPGAVIKPPGTQLQPDILVVPSRFNPNAGWLKVTEHWLVVEVLSRSSRKYDRHLKRKAYFDLGVREVWIVDPRAKSIEVWRDADSSKIFTEKLEWSSPVAGIRVVFDLSDVFAGID